MTKQELLAALALKFHAVGSETLQVTDGAIKLYSVPVFDKSGDNLVRRNEDFFVEDEGSASEAAYWSGGEPGLGAFPGAFSADAEAFIDAKIADATILAGFVLNLDEENEVATAVGYVDQAGVISEVKVVLSRDGSGNVQFATIDNVFRDD